MKFSEAWLREWVDPGIGRDALLEQLTMAGLEVDGVESVAGPTQGAVVARIESTRPHPDAAKLQVCTVFDGAGRHQVVCGAPNARPGLLSAYARVGAVLPGDVRIERVDLRGVRSAGMLCSAAELGMGTDADTIVELAENHDIGTDLVDALALDDVAIDLDLTPNRGDCLGLRGLAREVGVLNDLPVRRQRAEPVSATVATTFPVMVEDPAGCPRYLGRVIENIDMEARTPLWMKERLRRSGLRSIDPVVDVTNYVLAELGQPMHAFDLDRLAGGIVVRRGRAGDTLKLLDGREITPDADALLIADGAGAVAVAGVMGGERSGVGADTANIFLECAFFTPLVVAGAARRFSLHTDASHRYERGVDFELQAEAMERATQLLLDIVGGRAGPVVEAVDRAHLPVCPTVTLRQTRLDALAGVTIAPGEVDPVLARLDFAILERSETETAGVVWKVGVPSHRFDIRIEADLIEEVCRIYGYDRIPGLRPAAPLALRSVSRERSSELTVKRLLAAAGFQEVITYSFVDPAVQNLLDPGGKPLSLANPISVEQSAMRTNLLPGLVDALRFNRQRQQTSARLFEFGFCFRAADKAGGGVAEQVAWLGGLLWGDRGTQSWHRGSATVDFFDAKGCVEQLLEWAGLREVAFEPGDEAILHPGQRATIVGGDGPVGRLGRLHPELEHRLDIGVGVYVFELRSEAVLSYAPRRFRPISRMPSVRRDLALVLDEKVPVSAVRTTLAEALGDILVDLRIFDVYRGKGIDSNEKSVAVGLTFQHPAATLTEERISGYVARAVAALRAQLGAKLR